MHASTVFVSFHVGHRASFMSSKLKQSGIHAWLATGDQKELLPLPRRSWLPNPNQAASGIQQEDIAVANAGVEEALDHSAAKRRKRGQYHVYDSKTRLTIARVAEECGLTKACTRIEKLLNHRITKSTVQSIRNAYRKELLSNPRPEEIVQLPEKGRGRPLLLGPALDKKVMTYLHALRNSGCVVNRRIVLGCALGLIQKNQPSLLQEHGGSLDFRTANGSGRSWCNSFLKRAHFVKRKSTKAAKKLPANFQEQKQRFLDLIASAVKTHDIPSDLIINIDETGLRVVPVDKWTLDRKGVEQVALTGQEDKREITCVLGCTLSGKLLPPQVIYQGMTERCHPCGISYPTEWDIWHSETHWCTQETMMRYIQQVLLPWLEQTRKKLRLPKTQKSLIVIDVYKAHRTEDVIQAFRKCGFEIVYVPGNTTSELQPLDLSVNSCLKRELKQRFTSWYADKVCSAMKIHRDDATAAGICTALSLDGKGNVKFEMTDHQCPGLVNTKPMPQLKDSASTSTTSAMSVPLVAVASTQIKGAFTEHYFQSHLCQSQIDGRRGSSACTVIAILISHRFLCEGLQTSHDKGCQLLTDSCDTIISCLHRVIIFMTAVE